MPQSHPSPATFNLKLDGLYLELGRNYWDKAIRQQVFQSLEQQGLKQAIQKLFHDNKINAAENRAVSHVAWRNLDGAFDFSLNDEIKKHSQRNNVFAQQVISGEHRGFYGDRITDIVSIGIGGSYLGNALVCSALKDFHHGQLQAHFLTAPDPASLHELLQKINFKTTLWLFNSKSFTTFETLTLLSKIKTLFLTEHPEEALEKHFFAITSQVAHASEQGFKPQQIFYFDEGIGGRFSLWTSSGLIILLTLGLEHYQQLLMGAHLMDQHFHSAPLSENIPVCLAWLDYYYSTFLKVKSRAVVPYSSRLHLLPNYLQQLEMESLGKSVLRDGTFSKNELGLVVWGGIGPDAQHAFHQFLYQSDQVIPVDFVLMKKTKDFQELQNIQLAQCLAQSKALWEGNDNLKNNYEIVKGQKPSNLIIIDQLDPFSLGALLAMYEHKVFVLGELYCINAFDQFGVELGKKLSQPMLQAFSDPISAKTLDQISHNTINLLKTS
jgi:glucose-6-phosphate isomerase